MLTNMPAIYPWINDTKIVLIVALMSAAIFSAMIAVYIFREPQEDGTELLICSKPLERRKLILAKILAYCIFLVVFSLIPVAVFLIMFAFPQFNIPSIGWLMVGFICGNLVSMFLFGSIAALFSLKFNKIVVIVANMALCIVLAIYNTVVVATAPTPLGQMIQQKKYAATAVPYIGKDNKARAASYFLPTNTDLESAIKIASLDGQREIWKNAVDGSPIDILDGFNFASQLSRVYWSGKLEEAWYNATTAQGIGLSMDMHFNITDSVNKSATNFVDPKQIEENKWKPLLVNDDDPSTWSNIGKVDAPASWLDTSNVNRSDTFTLVKNNSRESDFKSWIEAMLYMMESLIVLNTKYNVDTACTSSPWVSGNSIFFNDVSRTKAEDTYTIETFYNGQQVELKAEEQVWQNLEPSEYEIDLFNYMLYEILFADDYYGDNAVTKGNDPIFSDDIKEGTWKISLNSTGPGSSYPVTNKVIYKKFFNREDVKEKLNLHDAKAYGKEVSKFKYYAYLKLTGQAGKVITDPSESGVDNYDVKNFTKDGNPITVPWDAYYKCVYYPQYNSLNVANMSEFKDNSTKIPIIGISIKDIVQQLIGSGFIPINNFANAEGSHINWLNTALSKIIYHPAVGTAEKWQEYGVNRLTPTYNGAIYGQGKRLDGSDQLRPGTINGVKYADESMFYAYDFTVDPNTPQKWSAYPVLNGNGYTWGGEGNQSTAKYGYISRLGLMASGFLSNYVFSDYNQLYYGQDEESADWIEEYKSKMTATQTPYFVYTWMLFNCDASAIMSPGAYAAIYLAISFMLLSLAYVKFVRYDFK